MARKKAKARQPEVQIRRQPARKAKTAAQIKRQAKAAPAVVRDEMVISSEELGQILLEHINGQYDGFLPEFSVSGNLNHFDRSSSDAIQSSVEELESDSWLDVELVYFAIRKLLQEDQRIPHAVHVIPTLCPNEFERSIQTLVHDKIVAEKEKYEDIILLREKDCDDDDPVHAENRKRTGLIKAKIEEILFNNNLDSDAFIKIFLQKIMNEQGVDFAKDQQIVIPIRVGSNHFTVAVVHISDQKATISYKDSFNSQCPDSIRQPIVDFFKQQLGADNVSFNNIKVTSQQKQRNGYDCGVFAILNGLDMVRQNAGLAKFLPDSITPEYLLMYRGFLFCLYESLGLKIKLELGFHKLLNQKMNHIFDESQKLFQNNLQKNQATDQVSLLIDLIHNPENGLAKSPNLVNKGKGRLELLNNNGSELDIILRTLRSLGKDLIKISEKNLTINQKEFVQEQVQETNKILAQMNKIDKTSWFDNPVIQAVKKAAIVTACVVLVGLVIANLPMIQALEGLLASSSSLFIPVAAAMFSACFLLAVKMPGWLSSDTENNSSVVETGIPSDLNATDNNDFLPQPTKVLTPGFEQSKQPQAEELNEISDKVEEALKVKKDLKK